MQPLSVGVVPIGITIKQGRKKEVEMALSFAANVRPLFRDGDVKCMERAGVRLIDHTWMCIPANALSVYGQLSSGNMPPDAPWPPDRIALFKNWMDAGYPA